MNLNVKVTTLQHVKMVLTIGGLKFDEAPIQDLSRVSFLQHYHFCVCVCACVKAFFIRKTFSVLNI